MRRIEDGAAGDGLEMTDGFRPLRVGERIRVVPNHCCRCAAKSDVRLCRRFGCQLIVMVSVPLRTSRLAMSGSAAAAGG